jgi:hypothetical protein
MIPFTGKMGTLLDSTDHYLTHAWRSVFPLITNGVTNLDGVWQPQESSHATFLWFRAPATAPVAVDELALSCLKHPHLLHICLCPWLLTHLWRKSYIRQQILCWNYPRLERQMACTHAWAFSVSTHLTFNFCLPLATKEHPTPFEAGAAGV